MTIHAKKLAATICILASASALAETNISAYPERYAPRNNAESEKKYTIYLNPFAVQDAEEELKNSRFQYFSSPFKDVKITEHQPGTVSVIQQLSIRHGLEPLGMTSWISPSFSAWLTQAQLELLSTHPNVTGVQEVSNQSNVFSLQSASGDIIDGQEVRSWARAYLNVVDDITTSNPAYIVDSQFPDGVPQSDLNFQIVWNKSTAPDGFNIVHAAHVAGVLGARVNGTGAVGINPGQPLRMFGVSGASGVAEGVDMASATAEASDQFSVVNVSINEGAAPSGVTQEMNFRSNRGIGRTFRAASNRLLVVNSAGNVNNNACNHAYNNRNTAQANDGIVVVGGLTRSGTRWVDPNNQDDPGSNYGNCVEIWAPADEITSTEYNFFIPNINSTRVSSGTSYSAPMVAALALRYGDMSTRPIEREQYLRSSMVATGHNDGTGPIYAARYTAPSSHQIAKRLPISTSYSQTQPINLHTLYDGKFFNNASIWNAGANWGSVVLDLGTTRMITGVRLTLRTSAPVTDAYPQPVAFALGGGNSPTNIPQTLYFDEPDQSDLAPIYIPFQTTNRYLLINGNNPYSNLGYSEIEVYGY